MEIRLLGPVELWAGGRLVPVGSPQRRAVLAALAVDAGRPVPVETLIDRVWGDTPPAQVRSAVHARVTHIRRLLAAASTLTAASAEAERGAGKSQASAGGRGRAGEGGLVWEPGGYVLRIDRDRVDVHRFRGLAAAARRRGCPDDRRVELLADALGRWVAEPLAGLPGEWAARMRRSWALERLDVTVEWARAVLRVGRPGVVIPVLRDLTEAHPLSEPAAVVLVQALAAEGRTSEALDCCAAVSTRLVTELGTDPGLELRRVQQALLHGRPLPPGTPAPTPPPVVAARAPVGQVVPAQLPADVYGFAGRSDHLARLDRLLATAGDEQPTAVVITAVSGTAGVGKTTLAVRWAHQVADRFPDGQLYVNLRGFHPAGQVVTPAEAIRGFLDAFGVPAERIPSGVDAQAALYRSLLSGKRVLVVLDNARDAEHARPLLPGTGTALAVVTSRDQLTGLVAADGAHLLTLDVLTPPEASELLSRRLGADRVAAEPRATGEIITSCARLPLALTIAAARAAAHPTFPLAAVAAELTEAGGRAAVSEAGDLADEVRAVFSWSYTALTPAAARLFRLLGLHPGPDICAPAAASLAGAPQTRPLLAELTRASLLAEHAPGRYTFHDLLRAYAAGLAHSHDCDQQRRAATERTLDHYLHTAYAANRLLDPTHEPLTLTLPPAAPGTAPEQLGGHQQAMAWLTAEHAVLLAAVGAAARAGFDTHTWQLAWTLDTFLWWHAKWREAVGIWQTALAASQRLADPAAQALAHRHLGWNLMLVGHYEQAHGHHQHALALHTAAGDLGGMGHSHGNIAATWQRQARPDLALDHSQQAYALFRAAGHQPGQAAALGGIGWYHARLGDYRQALTDCQQALTLQQQLADQFGEAGTWDNIGDVHHHLGRHTDAVDCYQRAIGLYRDLGDRHHHALTLANLGDAEHAAGHATAARTAWQHALDILTDLDHPDAHGIRATLDLHHPPHPLHPPHPPDAASTMFS